MTIKIGIENIFFFNYEGNEASVVYLLNNKKDEMWADAQDG